MQRLVGVLALTVALSALVAEAAPYDMPVVAVLGVPVSEGCDTLTSTLSSSVIDHYNGTSCFASIYVKWLEAAGALVVPLHHDIPASDLDALSKQVNGFLFTGGGLDFNAPNAAAYMRTARHIFDLVVNSKDGLALWGTCMGFQLINVLAANTTDVLAEGAFDSEDLSLALDMTDAGRSSRLWKGLPTRVQDILASQNVTSNLHHDGIPPAKFYSHGLDKMFIPVSTNMDRHGAVFLSTIEARSHPIWATQWHPERPQFELKPALNINHGGDAIMSMQSVANFFVSQLRAQPNRFSSLDALYSALVENAALVNQGLGFQSFLY